MTENWIELWADFGRELPYLLVLRPVEGKGFEVIDAGPEYGKIWHEAHSYEDAKLWLLEDEYEFVRRIVLNSKP